MIMNRFKVPQKAQYMIMAFMSKMGFLPGVSDIIIGHDGKMYCLELKVGNNEQSKGQKLFEANCVKCGIEYRVAWSYEEVMEIMRGWGIVK